MKTQEYTPKQPIAPKPMAENAREESNQPLSHPASIDEQETDAIATPTKRTKLTTPPTPKSRAQEPQPTRQGKMKRTPPPFPPSIIFISGVSKLNIIRPTLWITSSISSRSLVILICLPGPPSFLHSTPSFAS